MRVRRRTNFLWGLVLLVIALIVTAQALGLIPAPIYDMIVRSWPVVLVLAGLSLLLRGRVPFSGLIAVAVSVALVVALAAYSFSSRAQERRTDYQQTIQESVSDGLGLLRVRVSTLGTDVELLRAVNASAGIQGSFIGSSESRVGVSYDELGDGSGTLTVQETRPNALPMLDAVGRGVLRLELPADVPLDVELIGADGSVTLNMQETELERLNLDLARGDAVVTLPVYSPVSAAPDQSQGTLAVRNGDMTIVVPAAIAAQLELDRGGSGIEPEYDPSVYNFLFNRVLEARAIELADILVRYTIVAPAGRIRLEVTGEAAPEATPAAESSA